MDFFIKTKIRGVTKLVRCNSNESDVFDFIAKSKLQHFRRFKIEDLFGVICFSCEGSRYCSCR